MIINAKKQLLIDPTSPKSAAVLGQFLPQMTFVNANNSQHYGQASFMLTHSIVRFTKPRRTSSKGKNKPEQDYYLVFDPDALGSGTFGSVHSIIGTWHLDQNTWVFKSKQDPQKKRVLKTNAFLTKQQPNIADLYFEEQDIGQWVAHLDYKYPCVTHAQHHFLMMREQAGVTLENLLSTSNDLTVYQRLQITVNLLHALKDQLHVPQLPSPPDSTNYIVHRDIKPGNLMVNAKREVKLIDFGLAIPYIRSTRTRLIVGTPAFVDPYLFSRTSNESFRPSDEHSDYASAARVIAELWGDVSRMHIISDAEHHHYNRSNYLHGLFNGIKHLDKTEQLAIQDTIQCMTAFSPHSRLSRRKALKVFEELLARRLDNQKIQATETALGSLSSHQLFEVLQGPYADLLLKRLHNKPHHCKRLLPIQINLLQLDEPILQGLKTAGLDVTHVELTLEHILALKYSPDAFRKHFALGAKPQPQLLKKWINHGLNNQSTDRLYWIQICRIIHQVKPQDEPLPHISPSNEHYVPIFCRLFLTQSNASSDDKSTLRLIDLHMKHSPVRQGSLNIIRNLLAEHAPNSALAQQLFGSEYFADSLQLEPCNDLTLLRGQLATVCNRQFDPIPSMPKRQKKIELFQAEFKRIIHLTDMDLPTALSALEVLSKQIAALRQLDNLYKEEFGLNCPRSLVDFDAYYSQTSPNLIQLTLALRSLRFNNQLLNNIESIRRNMMVTFPTTAFVEQHYQKLTQSIRLENPCTQNEVSQLYNTYSIAEQLVHRVHPISSIEPKNSRSRFLAQLLDVTFNASKVLGVEKTNLLVNQCYNFSFIEEELSKMYKTNSLAMDFIYDVLGKSMQKNAANPSIFGHLSKILSSVNYLKLIDTSILNSIEHFVKVSARSSDASKVAAVQEQFEDALWTYFTVKTEHVGAHRRTTIDKLNDLSNDLTSPSSGLYRFFCHSSSSNSSPGFWNMIFNGS